MTARCTRFANQLRGRFGIAVDYAEERLSSVEAEERLRESCLLYTSFRFAATPRLTTAKRSPELVGTDEPIECGRIDDSSASGSSGNAHVPQSVVDRVFQPPDTAHG